MSIVATDIVGKTFIVLSDSMTGHVNKVIELLYDHEFSLSNIQ